MATTQSSCVTWLKVEGSLYQEDAELLEKICRDIGEQTGAQLTLDLADLCFLDSDSASVLSASNANRTSIWKVCICSFKK